MNKIQNLSQHLATLLITAWAGGLWAIGYLAVPVLFFKQADRQLAGLLAGQLFSLVGYLGIVCGTYLLIQRFVLTGRLALRKPLFWVIAAMLMLTLAIHFGTRPTMAELKQLALPLDVMLSAYADRFNLLHRISSACYHLMSLLAIFLVIGSRSANDK